MTKIILDTEGTGLKDPRVIELGFINLDAIFDPYNIRCNPGVPIELLAMAVHGITQEDIYGLLPLGETANYRLLESWNSPDNIIIGHNIFFDLIALKNEGFINQMKVIDTYKVIYRLFQDAPLESYKLTYLRYYLGTIPGEIDHDKRVKSYIRSMGLDDKSHSALTDCYVNLQVYEFLTKHYSDEEMIQISSEPFLLRTISFGKYKLQKFEDVVKTDRQYVEWLFNEELKKMKDSTDDEKKANNFLMTLLYWLSKTPK